VLTTSVERLEGNKVKLTVTIPAAEVEKSVEAAYKTLGSKYKVPGFRPGKAPRPVLDNMLGREYILGEATEHAVNSSYPKALDAEELRPIEPPVMDELDTVEPGVDYTYIAEIDVRPELTLSSIEGLTVALPPREATEADIELQIDMARERFATLEPVEDRGAADDDFVLLSFTGTVGGESYEGNVVDKYLYEMGRGMMPAEFDAGLVGAKAGDEPVIEFEIPDTTSNPEFAGKMARFEVTVHEVKAKKLPELDDEFAANAGGFDSYAEMVEDMRNRINVQKSASWDQLKEREARRVLAERLEGDIPEAMVRSRQNQMERDFMGMLEQREMTLQQYLAQSGVELEQFTADIAEQAEISVREELALEALFRQLGYEVTEEDVDAELATVSQSSDETPEQARARWEELGLMAIVHEQIQHTKASQWLFENVEVTLRPDAADEEAADTDAAADEAGESESEE